MGLFSSRSSSNTSNYTQTQGATLQDLDGNVTTVVGNNNQVLDGGIIDRAFNFGENILEQLSSSNSSALERLENNNERTSEFISNYAKNSSERIFENITNYGGILGVGIALVVAYKYLK